MLRNYKRGNNHFHYNYRQHKFKSPILHVCVDLLMRLNFLTVLSPSQSFLIRLSCLLPLQMMN